MTKADSVLSTPPLNSSSIQNANPPPEARAESVDSFSHQPAIGQPESRTLASDSPKPLERLSRRNVLAGLAVLPVALPTAADRTVDPIFALIAAKQAADVAHGEAIDVQDDADVRYGYDSQQAWDADEACGEACHRAMDAAWQLVITAPTTLAGVVGLLRFANQHEDEGFEWPATDFIGRDGWHYQLRATMAAAIEAIIKAQAGQAVQS
jgi:hypothetical protein